MQYNYAHNELVGLISLPRRVFFYASLTGKNIFSPRAGLIEEREGRGWIDGGK